MAKKKAKPDDTEIAKKEQERVDVAVKENAVVLHDSLTDTGKDNLKKTLSKFIKKLMADDTVADEARTGLAKVHAAVMIYLPE